MAGGNAGPDTTYSSPEHIDRVARDFPNLVIVSAHGNWPWVSQIIHVCYRRPNIYLSPDMYLFGRLPGASDYINAANGFMADRFLFRVGLSGTAGGPGGARIFEVSSLRNRSYDRVLYTNAARLLGVD